MASGCSPDPTPCCVSPTNSTRQPLTGFQCDAAYSLSGRELVAAALNRGRDAHGLPVLGYGAARDLYSGLAQPLNDGVVRQHAVGALGVDQMLDAVAHRFSRMGIAAIGRRNRRGE